MLNHSCGGLAGQQYGNHPASNRIAPANKRSIPAKKLLIGKIPTISVSERAMGA
jgi:hypothetical protein